MSAVLAFDTGTVRHRLMLSLEQLKASERARLNSVLRFAEDLHDGQFRAITRLAGVPEPYVVHHMRVARIIIEELDLKDPEVISAALLHDVLEKTKFDVSVTDIEECCGRSIALSVAILTKPFPDSEIARFAQLGTFYGRIRQSHIATRLVFLADRLDNMRDAINLADSTRQQSLLEETRSVHLAIAQNSDQYLFDELESACEALAKQISQKD